MENRKLENKRIVRWLDPLLVILTLTAYLLYLNNREGQLKWGLLGIVVLLVGGGAVRAGLTYPQLFKVRTGWVWLRFNWPIFVLLVAMSLGGWFGWQAIRNAPPLTETETRLATNAVTIVKRSNWNTPAFNQPPLYLNLTTLAYEGAFLQQLNGGRYGSPDDLRPDSFLDLSRYVNLIMGLLTLLPLYDAAARLYSRQAGAIAALLLALAWTQYSSYARLEPQTLAAALLMLSFYFGVRGFQSQTKSWDFGWAGLLAGLATATAYGSILILVGLGLAWSFASQRERTSWWQILAGWLLGFTLGAAGWLLNLPSFINGLGSIGAAGEVGNTAGFYLKEFFSHDAGLLLLLILSIGLAIVKPCVKDWLALSFVVLYSLSLGLIGPHLYFRLDLLLPLSALAVTRPLELAIVFIQTKFSVDRYGWVGKAVGVGLIVAILSLSVVIRRLET